MKFAIIEPEIESYAPVIYKDIIRALNKLHIPYKLFRVRKKIKKKRAKYLKYPVLSMDVLKKSSLLIVYSPYATSHKAKKYCKQYKVPLLHLEHGFLPQSTLCDINGFWGDSRLINTISTILDKYMDEQSQKWANEYSNYLINNNISKRPQPDRYKKITKDFVFLPMQYMNDASVIQFGNMPYPRFMKHVTQFCADNNLLLAIKKHPHAYRKEPKNVNRILRKLQKRYNNVRIVDGSIHWFCQNCKFMAGMNTGATIDGLVNGTIISHCGQSIFMNTGAVVHNNNVKKGLQKCIRLKNNELTIVRKRQKSLLYYLYHYYLLLSNDTHNSKLSNMEKIINQINEKT